MRIFVETLSLLFGLGLALTSKDMKIMKAEFWENNSFRVKNAQDIPSVLNAPSNCIDGAALVDGEPYPCSKVDFLSLVGLADLKVTREDFEDSIFQMSDIWGYMSASGKEITLACQTNSIVFIDSTDPVAPVILGYMESHRAESFWCDVKVYKDTAYVVQDGATVATNLGIQVFDLKRLESEEVLNSEVPVKFDPDFTYAEHGPVHNVVIDVESGFLYNVGTSGGNDCNEGLHMVDLSDPLEPKFVGCAGEDGYVHDAQCLVYTGPDSKYFGEQICFGYNEDTLTIYLVTDKSAPIIISKTSYDTATYTHQGWLNADQDFLLLNDEADETRGGLGNTRTYIVNVTSLENPIFSGKFDHPVESVDHNLYFWGEILAKGWSGSPPVENPPSKNYVYCTNYASGLRILDTTDIKSSDPQLIQAGFFDVSPDFGSTELFGTWSSYMHPSGVIAVTSIETGVFFLNFTDAFTEPVTQQQTESPTIVITRFPTEAPVGSLTESPTITQQQTESPTIVITRFPTEAPVSPTTTPTSSPTISPTQNPSTKPTSSPSINPTQNPTATPTSSPLISPTTSPVSSGSSGDEDNSVLYGFIAFFWVVVAIAIVVAIAWQLRKRKIAAQTLIQSQLSARPNMPNRTLNPSFKPEVSV